MKMIVGAFFGSVRPKSVKDQFTETCRLTLRDPREGAKIISYSF